MNIKAAEIREIPSPGAPDRHRSGGRKLLAEIGLLALLYFGTARLGQLLAIPPGNITPVWIPSGIILAAVLTRGYRVWPGIFLGAFAGNVWAYFSTESLGALLRCLLAATANGIGDSLCAVGGAYLITRTVGGQDPFGRAADVIRFILFGAVLGSGVSALFGVTALGLAGFVPGPRYLFSLTTWWTGDAVGVLVITPMLWVWQAGWRGCRFGREELLFAVLLPTASLASWRLVPGVPGLVVLPLLLWAVFRFDRRVVFAAIFVEASLIIVLATLGGGPFAVGKSSGAMMNLPLFVTLITVPLLVLGGALAEGARIQEQLRELKRELEQRVRDRAERLAADLVEQQRLAKPADESRGFLGRAGGRRLGLAVLLVGLIATAVAAYYARPIVDATVKREFSFDSQEIQDRISSRLAAHEQVLRSGAAFFAHGSGISRLEWRRFVERQNIEQRLTGIQGVGFARRIPREKLAQHIEEVRAEGFPDYQVRPAGERESYSAVVYLEPFAGRNLRAFGYDMLSEPIRRAAMERARDLDAATLSGKVRLVQETAEDVQAGALMFVPVYGAGMPVATVDQRRAALQGWVYSPYRMTDLMRGILGQWDSMTDRRIRLEVFDGETMAPEALLYDSQSAVRQPVATAGSLTFHGPLEVAGHPWSLRFTKTGDSTADASYSRTWLLLFGGTVVSLLLCGLVFGLVDNRLKAARRSEQLEAELAHSETKARRSTELLQEVVDHSQCLVYAKDLQGRFILASDPLASFFGQSSHQQLLGNTSHDYLPPAIADQHRANDLAVIARRSPVQTEETTETPDGPRVFLSTKFPLVDGGGQVVAVCGVSFDITEHKQAELALRKSEERFARLFAEAPLGIALIDSLTGHIDEVNPMFARIAGRTMEEVRQIDWMSITHPEDVQADLDNMALMNAGKITGFQRVKRYLRPDGTAVWIHLTIAPVKVEDARQPKHLAMVEDITARKRAEVYRGLIHEILRLLSGPDELRLLMPPVFAALRATTGVDTVGLRLQEGDDFPYFYQEGFSTDFLLRENSLLRRARDGGICKDATGKACLECTCGLVLAGQIDPANPLFTHGGSARINDSSLLLALPANEDPRTRPRNECIRQGYGSVALIPVRAKGRIVGLLQFNARAKESFTLDMVTSLEDVGRAVGEALVRKRAEEALQKQTVELRARNEELERFNRVMSARELRGIELKQQVNDLAAELGRPRPYPLAFLDTAATEIVRTAREASNPKDA